MSVKFVVSPSWATVSDADAHALRTIDVVTSARDPGAHFSTAYQRGYTDGHYRLFDRQQSRFPAGLLVPVCEALTRAGTEYEIDASGINYLNAEFCNPPGIELRDYQQEAVEAAIEWGRGILGLPVNAGKSYVALALTESYGCPAVVLAASLEGLEQLYKLFASTFGESRVSTDVDQGADIVLLSYTSATKRDLSPYPLLVADEVHRVAADTFYEAVIGSGAYHRFGLSGTPGNREDGKDIYFYGATGPVIHSIPQSVLVERGYSAQASVVMLDVQGQVPMPPGKIKWQLLEERGIVENATRNDMIAQVARRAMQEGRQTLIMVRRIQHGEELQESLAQVGLANVPFTHGSLGQAERSDHYEDFKSGRSLILIASGIYDDSVDVPGIEVLINASGGKSLIQTKQRMGRGLRNPGGKTLLMIDFMDRHHRVLARHSVRRKRAYEEEGFQVETVGEVLEIKALW